MVRSLAALVPGASDRAGTPVDPAVAATLFEAQVASRLVDHTARWLRTVHGLGYYTIGSAGHEANGAVALALRVDDPALLHYRSGGFYFARASQRAGQDPVGDVLRGMLARTTEPIAGGRHKVFGSVDLSIIPQTSTIASHLPRAVGLARSFDHAREAPVATAWPTDAVVVCSFGDASFNHSTAQGALNWAANAAHRGQRVPVLFVCEDNGLGISVPTPAGWVAAAVAARARLDVVEVDGTDPGSVLAATAELAASIRSTGRPGFLLLHTVRYLGHAGTDVETAYRTPGEIRADHERDPILGTARALVAAGHRPVDLVDWVLDERLAVRQRALDIAEEKELVTAEEVMEPLAPRRPRLVAAAVAADPIAPGHHPTRRKGPGTAGPLTSGPVDGGTGDGGAGDALTLAQTINRALARALADPTTLLFGEDVGRKGGVYGVTRGLQREFGERQVFDTILDEQSILGLALGAGLNGFLPIPEIQYLAYLHNAADQLRGEAATLSFFSQGRYRNPMVVRIAGYAYQRGFGGHFHNDNAVAALRDIPGLVIASPSHPADAGPMLATCVAAARVDGAVSVFLEPIARYHTVDLHHDGDRGWVASGPPPGEAHVPIGTARTHGDGTDGTILTWGNGLYLSLRAARRLRDETGEGWRVVDLRWLAPLPVDDLVGEADATGRVLVVDETRHAGGVGEGVLTALVEVGYRGVMGRVAARDSIVPLGAAAELVLVSEDEIIAAARRLG
ncbi:MAG: thiamine pyrophosphate-dependent enzyme [Acidimicrobiales bacterium]